MLRALALIAALLVAPPALAQQRAAVDLLATAVLGVADGAVVSLGGALTGKARQDAPGHYYVSANGHDFDFFLTETSPCVFRIRLVVGNGAPMVVRIDANRIARMEFTENQPIDGVNQFTLAFSGAGAVHVVPADGAMQPVATTTIGTGLAGSELDAAARAFRILYCKGIGG
jgi:hypothetical protein